MKKISILLILSMIIASCFINVFAQDIKNDTKAHDYAKEINAGQFRPHGGDNEEFGNAIDLLFKNINIEKELPQLVAGDTAQKQAVMVYLNELKQYTKLEAVDISGEKLYITTYGDDMHNMRAIIKAKYLCYTKDKEIIEKTDYLGFAKLDNKWKLWGTIWLDTGINVSDAKLTQPDKPAKGEEICIIKTTEGDIKIRLFPDKTPKTVENFKTLAKNGYYNNTEFFRTINDFMIQGGDKRNNGEGNGGKDSIYGKEFEDEFSRDLFNFRGALSMANAGPDTNESQFFIVQRPKVVEAHLALTSLPLNAEAKYKEIGGTPHLDKRHTVFGQVFEGMNIVDKIAVFETDENAKPKKAAKIIKIEFVKY